MGVRRHSLYNVAGSLVPSAVTLLTVPVYLRLIGDERYGILVIVWVLLGYFTVFDLGLGRATAQRISSLRQAEPGERAEAFWTALMLNTACGVVGGLSLWLAARYYFTAHFNVAEPLRMEILGSVSWLAAALPVATISGVLGGALQGRERFLALNASNVFGAVLFQLLPLAVAWLHGPDLAWLVPAALLGRVAAIVVLFAHCYRHVPLNMAPSVRHDLVKPMFRYGGWVSVTGIIAPLLTTLDRFLIGSIVGPKAVTAYQVPYSLALQVIVLPWSVSTTLFPRFSATPDEESDRLMNEAIRALKVILTPMIIAGILIMEPFLTWWVGSELAREGAYVGEIIALGLWFNGLAVIPFARLQGQGRPDLVAKCHLAEFIPYVAFLGFALYAWGLVGAALAWSLRMAVDAILLFWMCGIGSRHFVASLPPLLLLGIGGAAVFGFPHGSILRWSVGGIAMLGSLAWAWWAAPDSVRRLVGEGYQLLPRLPKT